MKNQIFASLFLFAACAVPNAQAVLIAYEDFDTTAGSDNVDGISGAGSSGWDDPWSLISADNSGDVISPGYNYSALTTAGNRVSVGGDLTPTYYYRNLSSPFVVTSGTADLWGSFILDTVSTATTGRFAQVGFLSAAYPSATTRGFTVGAVGGSANYRLTGRSIDGSTAGIVGTTTVSADTEAFMVFKLTLDNNAFNNATVSIWINPNLGTYTGTEASLGAATLTMTDLDYAGTGVYSVAFGSNYLTGTGLTGLDELRLGTGIGDVIAVPEPGIETLLFCGLAACTLMHRRRTTAGLN